MLVQGKAKRRNRRASPWVSRHPRSPAPRRTRQTDRASTIRIQRRRVLGRRLWLRRPAAEVSVRVALALIDKSPISATLCGLPSGNQQPAELSSRSMLISNGRIGRIFPFVGVVACDTPLACRISSTPRELRDLVTPTSRSAIHR